MQIANGLFRDSRISYRAKGLSGCISTHRNGWLVTIAALVTLGPDVRDAVRAGLSELQEFGYLVRDRGRRPDGTLAEIVYSITDRPAVPDFAPIDAASTVQEPASDAGFGAGVRRGVMAAGRFTRSPTRCSGTAVSRIGRRDCSAASARTGTAGRSRSPAWPGTAVNAAAP
ncbi:hypothetical protein [Streptomyces sp. NPDC056628]|uniref:hypothetical protein n=1 Tax=Streptomyces sp. NPDC056628 TaxID=3345882 RepID=UPI003682CD6B